MFQRQSLRAVLCRSGTSKGLFLRRSDLPPRLQDWTPIILSAVGSPDPYRRQLDGLGGGSSTTSKVAIVGPCEDRDVAGESRLVWSCHIHLHSNLALFPPHQTSITLSFKSLSTPTNWTFRAIAATCQREWGLSRWSERSQRGPLSPGFMLTTLCPFFQRGILPC
jgi:hypothetical protein